MFLHWFDGSTYNGNPISPATLTLCGKLHKEDHYGDKIVREGACHPYQVTCPRCKELLAEKSKKD